MIIIIPICIQVYLFKYFKILNNKNKKNETHIFRFSSSYVINRIFVFSMLV